MRTHAYERFRENGFTYELANMDTSGLTVAHSFEGIELNKPIVFDVEKSGRYIIELEISTELSALAQIAVIAQPRHYGVGSGTLPADGICRQSAKMREGDRGVRPDQLHEFQFHRI